tara:strand:- start:2770 stop:4758 length:1989 start_codon:yes stop_codon:yes gene_type:complete
MATKKISDFTATTTPLSSAVFPIVQSSSNLKVTLANIAANMPDLSATSITTSGTATATGGFVGNLTGNVTGNLTGVASSATALATGRTIGMTGDVTWTSASFDGSGNVTGTSAIGTGVIVNADVNTNAAIDATKIHDGTISNTEFGYLNNVSSNIQTQLDGKASSTYVPTAITVADESSDTTCFPLFTTAATGDLGPKTASGLTFNSSTDVLSGTFAGNITGNVTGNVSGTSGSTTGNAATATALATARNIGGVSFDGTANIDLPGVNATGTQNTSGQAGTVARTRGKDYKSDWGSSSSPISFEVKVITKTSAHPYTGVGSSSAYTIDGVEGAVLNFDGADTGKTYYYRFDQSDSSNSTHPLRFYLDAAKSTAYTTNVTTNGTPGSSGAYTQIQVDEYTPNLLYYQCSSHAHMGNYIHHISNMINSSGTLIKLPTSDGSNGQVLQTNGSGVTSFVSAATATYPTVSSISPSTIGNDATSITITGTNFVNGIHVEAISSTGAIFTPNSVSFTNSTTAVANFTIGTDSTYFIRVENPDGLAARSSSALLTVSDAPTWSTSAGSLGSVAAGASVSLDVDASSDSTVAFSETTSVLTSNSDTPASTMNLTLNSSTGAITGTAPAATAETTYNFTLRATDAESQTADRAFSITVTVGVNNSALLGGS